MASSGYQPYPLTSLPMDLQKAIAEAVAQPYPPPRTKLFRDENGRVYCAMTSRAWFEWYSQRGIDPFKHREKIPEWMRERVIARDGMFCGLCRSEIAGLEELLHIDHVVPVARGGRTVLSNLQPAHARCNMRKGARAEAR